MSVRDLWELLSTRSPQAGAPGSTSVLPSQCMEVEQAALLQQGYSDGVMRTLLASHRDSTRRVYNLTWRKFSYWYKEKGYSELNPKVWQILEFPQEGLDKGLSTNMLKRQVATLNSILETNRNRCISSHCHVRFLKRDALLNPPKIHSFPSWDL